MSSSVKAFSASKASLCFSNLPNSVSFWLASNSNCAIRLSFSASLIVLFRSISSFNKAFLFVSCSLSWPLNLSFKSIKSVFNWYISLVRSCVTPKAFCSCCNAFIRAVIVPASATPCFFKVSASLSFASILLSIDNWSSSLICLCNSASLWYCNCNLACCKANSSKFFLFCVMLFACSKDALILMSFTPSIVLPASVPISPTASPKLLTISLPACKASLPTSCKLLLVSNILLFNSIIVLGSPSPKNDFSHANCAVNTAFCI